MASPKITERAARAATASDNLDDIHARAAKRLAKPMPASFAKLDPAQAQIFWLAEDLSPKEIALFKGIPVNDVMELFDTNPFDVISSSSRRGATAQVTRAKPPAPAARDTPKPQRNRNIEPVH